MLAVMIHEVTHGFVAWKCGDTTAKDLGRLSLNPIRHVDPFGTIVFPLMLALLGTPFIFGWAKPVPINLSRTRNPKQAFWLTAIAGPASNLLQAILAVLVFHVTSMFDTPVMIYVTLWLLMYIVVNVFLMAFNLLPVPPLDGSKVLAVLLPDRVAMSYLQIERFGMLIIFALLYLNVLDPFLDAILKGFFKVSGLF